MNPNQPDPLIEELRKDLNTILAQRVDGEVELEKPRQYLRLDKADNYYRGNPYIAAEYDAGTGSLSWSSVGAPIANVDNQPDLYDYNIDVTKSYGRKYYSVLGTRPFHNAKALPDDPKRDEDRKAARMYELAAIYCKTKWNARVMNIMVFYHQWKSGTVYAFVDHVADKKLWGETTEPVIEPKTVEMEPAGYRCTTCGVKSPEPQILPVQDQLTGEPIDQSVCPNCGAELSEIHSEPAQTAEVPEVVGHKTYANAGPRVTLTTGYQVTVPFDTKALDTAPWLLYEYEEHPGALLQLYRKELAEHLDDKGELKKAGNEEGQLHEQGKRYRKSAASLNGERGNDERAQRWTYSRYWLASFMYEYVKDEKKRELLKESYPDGLKITKVEGHIVKLDNDAIVDSWAAFQPEPSDFLYCDPMCWGILGHQDITNDSWNMFVAILERVMPSGFFDPDVIDGNALQERSHLCEWLPAKPNTSGRLDTAITKAPTAAFPDHAFPMLAGLESNIQSYTGLQPSVFGGGEKTDTAEQARIQLTQALQQLAVPGEFAGQGWKDVLTLAVNKIKKFGLKAGAIPTGGDDSELFDVDALQGGNAHFQTEPGVPMSWGERRDQLNHIIGQNPQLASALGIDSQSNIPAVRDYLLPGMEELQIPGENRRQKVVEVIRELLQGKPTQGMIGMDGMEGPPQPSILPEPFVDDPQDAQLVLEWLMSDPGRKTAKENPGGRQNVVAYGMALGSLPPPMGTPPPMLAPPGEDGPPPPKGGKEAPPTSGGGAMPPPMQ